MPCNDMYVVQSPRWGVLWTARPIKYHCMSPPLGGMAVEASRRLPLGDRREIK